MSAGAAGGAGEGTVVTGTILGRGSGAPGQSGTCYSSVTFTRTADAPRGAASDLVPPRDRGSGRVGRVRGRAVGGQPLAGGHGLRRARPGSCPEAAGAGTGESRAGASGLWMAEVGAVVVQICHKGRCAVRVAEMKPRDSAVLSAAHRGRSGLCGRFGHRARVRCLIRARCRVMERVLGRGLRGAEPHVRGPIPGLVRRAGLHRRGSAPPVHRARAGTLPSSPRCVAIGPCMTTFSPSSAAATAPCASATSN